MPIPSPKGKEDQKAFISRCAGDPTMNKDYPDNKQRVAICYSQWKKAKKHAKAVIDDFDNEYLVGLDEEAAAKDVK